MKFCFLHEQNVTDHAMLFDNTRIISDLSDMATDVSKIDL